MTPRAFADETIELLKPLSCHAIAAASEGATPYWAATDWMSPAPTLAGVGTGSAAGTTGAGAGSSACAGAGAPLGSLIGVPATSTPSGSRPFIAATSATDAPAPAASPERVSPGRTVYAPCTAGAPPDGAGAGAAPAPPGTDSELPATMIPAGSRPLAAARSATETPALAAMPESVSPGWTV